MNNISIRTDKSQVTYFLGDSVTGNHHFALTLAGFLDVTIPKGTACNSVKLYLRLDLCLFAGASHSIQ